MVGVQCWDMLYLGYNSLYKGDSVRFSLNLESWKMGLNKVVSGYSISTNIPRVDGLLTDPREMGRHTGPSTGTVEAQALVFIYRKR